jgi:hypothetical protein
MMVNYVPSRRSILTPALVGENQYLARILTRSKSAVAIPLALNLIVWHRNLPLLSGQELTIEPAWEYAQRLLAHLERFRLTEFILKIDEDVLGIYDHSGTKPKIELYWGIIGLVARDLNVSVEDLTCVVLAHEFAHAFTHVGSDANHLSWDSVQFQQAAHEVKEGLAQYFKALVCRQIKVRGAYDAYEKLLPQQPKAYQVHTEWNAKPESVRLAMMKMRRVTQQRRSLELFDQFLADAATQLDGGVA